MREQNLGRIIFTTSSGGLCGNFGQANYGAAKMGMIGLMNCLKIEGQKYNVFSSAVAPVALSRMTESLFPEGIGERFMPEYVTTAVIYLAIDDIENQKYIFSTKKQDKAKDNRGSGRCLLEVFSD